MNLMGFNGNWRMGILSPTANDSGVGYGSKVIHLPGQISRRSNYGGRSNFSKTNVLDMTDELLNQLTKFQKGMQERWGGLKGYVFVTFAALRDVTIDKLWNMQEVEAIFAVNCRNYSRLIC